MYICCSRYETLLPPTFELSCDAHPRNGSGGSGSVLCDSPSAWQFFFLLVSYSLWVQDPPPSGRFSRVSGPRVVPLSTRKPPCWVVRMRLRMSPYPMPQPKEPKCLGQSSVSSFKVTEFLDFDFLPVKEQQRTSYRYFFPFCPRNAFPTLSATTESPLHSPSPALTFAYRFS